MKERKVESVLIFESRFKVFILKFNISGTVIRPPIATDHIHHMRMEKANDDGRSGKFNLTSYLLISNYNPYIE
jgi:hypothetical protein